MKKSHSKIIVFFIVPIVIICILLAWIYNNNQISSLESSSFPRVNRTLLIEGNQRQYYQYTPKNPQKLLIVMHGGATTYDTVANSTQLSVKLSENDGVVLVYPDAINKNWNDGRLNSDGSLLHKSNDIDFIAAIINDITNTYSIPTEQVTIGGISNGSIFSQYFACGGGKVGKVFGVVGSLPFTEAGDNLTCDKTNVKNVVLIHGTKDPLMPFSGGKIAGLGGRVGNLGEVFSAEKTANLWKSKLDCNSEQSETFNPNTQDGSSVKKLTYQCLAGNFTWYQIIDGGHHWPGDNIFQLGKVNKDISASDILIKLAKE
jgi:polyhydroxybutyrate depolymerase